MMNDILGALENAVYNNAIADAQLVALKMMDTPDEYEILTKLVEKLEELKKEI